MIYREVAYPQFARWEIIGKSPAGDGWVFAREISTGQVLSFAPGQLQPDQVSKLAPVLQGMGGP